MPVNVYDEPVTAATHPFPAVHVPVVPFKNSQYPFWFGYAGMDQCNVADRGPQSDDAHAVDARDPWGTQR
jgi:hypothetical protein